MNSGYALRVDRHGLLPGQIYARQQHTKGCSTGIDRESCRDADQRAYLGLDAAYLIPCKTEGLMLILVSEMRFAIDARGRIIDM